MSTAPIIAKTERPILVTGAHRSGTTWTGEMLASASNVTYLYEPFNPRAGEPLIDPPFDRWFVRIGDHNEAEMAPRLDRLMGLHYPWQLALRRANTPRSLLSVTKRRTQFAAARLGGSRPLLKAPIALLSADWLSQRYNTHTVVMVRHPCAFVLSSMRMNYRFDFKQFHGRPEITDDLLRPYRDEIAHYAHTDHDALENAAVHWKHLHHVVKVYRERHPEWNFEVYEDLAMQPMDGFARLFETVGLRFDRRARQRVRAHCLSSREVADVGQQHRLIRDSRLSAWSWKRRADQADVNRIRALTQEVADESYPSSSWELEPAGRVLGPDGRLAYQDSLAPLQPR